jgi:hypothetical protein
METFTHSLETLVNSFMEDPQALLKDISLVKQEKMEGCATSSYEACQRTLDEQVI